MAKIHKLTKGGQTIYPATTTDAVVNPNSRKSLTVELTELEQELKYEIGEMTGESESLDITEIFIIPDTMLLSSGGTKANTSTRVSDYIKIRTGAKIVGGGLLANNGTAAIAFYDEKKNVIGAISLYGTGQNSIDVNTDEYPDARYYRVCCLNSYYNNTFAKISNTESIVSLAYNTPNSVVTKLDVFKKEMFKNKVICHADCGKYVDRTTGEWADAGADSNGCVVQVMPNSIISIYSFAGNKKCSTFAFLTDDTMSNESIVQVYCTNTAGSLYDNVTVPENANYIWVAVNPREESTIQRYIVKYDGRPLYDISEEIENAKAELKEDINNIEETVAAHDNTLYCIPVYSTYIENGYIRTDGTSAGSSGHSQVFYDVTGKTRLLLHTISTSAKEEKMAWWVLRDSSRNVIASAHFPSGIFANTIYDAIIDLPDSAVELVLNKTRATDDYYVKEYIVNLVEEVADTIERVSVIESSFKHTPLLCGDSTGGAIGVWLNKYSRLNGVEMHANNRGGEHTTAMGFYSGAIPAVVKPITIPSRGSTQIEIKSTLTNSSGNLTQLVAGQLGDSFGSSNLPRKGVNPVVIHGVQGTLSAGTSNVYGIHFYNSSNQSVGGYSSLSYARTIHPTFTGIPAKVRVCVNADSIEDLQNCSAHLTINNTIVELIPSIQHKGGLSPFGGVSTEYAHCMYSDYIDISQIGTINTIYIDGLAIPAEYAFTRLEDGDSVDVNEYDMIEIANRDFFKQCIPMYYVNNFACTGREKAADWVFVAKKLCKYHGDKFIFASTHFLFNSLTEDECSKIQNALANEFGERYFSGMAYLRDSGIRDAVRYGVYTSEEVRGKTWKELFLGSETNPDVHEKSEAGYLIARKFLEIGARLGYWELKDVDYAHLSAI